MRLIWRTLVLYQHWDAGYALFRYQMQGSRTNLGISVLWTGDSGISHSELEDWVNIELSRVKVKRNTMYRKYSLQSPPDTLDSALCTASSPARHTLENRCRDPWPAPARNADFEMEKNTSLRVYPPLHISLCLLSQAISSKIPFLTSSVFSFSALSPYAPYHAPDVFDFSAPV